MHFVGSTSVSQYISPLWSVCLGARSGIVSIRQLVKLFVEALVHCFELVIALFSSQQLLLQADNLFVFEF